MITNTGPSADLAAAERRIRRGYLSGDQRAALAALLLIAGTADALPTPVAAAVLVATTTLTTPPQDP